MKKTYHVLIIEDEPMTIDAYINALNEVQEHSEFIEFKIDTAKNCQTAYEKINRAINGVLFDLVFLDIRLPSTNGYKIRSGEDLGVMIRKEMPSAKIIILTSHFETAPLNAIWNKLRPDSFVVKSDLGGFNDLINIIEKVIDQKDFFSNRILTVIKHQAINKGVLNEFEIKILLEISNGAKMKELLELLPLGDSSIHKYKTHIKQVFGDRSMSDRHMILIAKEKGFI